MFIFILFIILLIILLFYLYSSSNKKISVVNNSYLKDINTLEKKIKKELSQEELIEKYKKLATLYHNGLSDNYIKGKLIKGIKPNPYKAIELYKKIGSMGDLSVLLDWASIHHWGLNGFEELEDHKKAKNIYLYFYHNSNNDYQKELAKERLESLGYIFPSSKKEIIYKKKDSYFPQSLIKKKPDEIQRNIFPLEGIRTIPIFTEIGNVRNIPIIEENKDEILEIRNDKNNVHDSVLIKTINNTINTLKNNTEIKFDLLTSLRDIRHFINNHPNISNDRRNNAIKVLDKIESNDIPLISSNITESFLLYLVWNRIHNDINKDNEVVLKENLVDELSESIEHDKVVCATGRFNRIIDTLNGVDPEVSLKPKWVLQKEMIEKAGVMFKEFIDNLSPEEKNSFENLEPTPEQEIINNNLIEKVKENIRNDFKKNYVENGIMSEKNLDTEINQWINDII